MPSLPQPKPTFANQVFVPAQTQQLTHTHAGVSGGTPVGWMISEIPGDVAAFVGTHRTQFFLFVCVKHLHTLRNSNNTNTCHSKWKQLQKSLMAHSDYTAAVMTEHTCQLCCMLVKSRFTFSKCFYCLVVFTSSLPLQQQAPQPIRFLCQAPDISNKQLQ